MSVYKDVILSVVGSQRDFYKNQIKQFEERLNHITDRRDKVTTTSEWINLGDEISYLGNKIHEDQAIVNVLDTLVGLGKVREKGCDLK